MWRRKYILLLFLCSYFLIVHPVSVVNAAESGELPSIFLLLLSTKSIRIEVSGTDPDGDHISYQWRSTDGKLDTNVGSVVNWTPPGGPGLHFVYALASDGRGGYEEQRVIIDTDDLNMPVKNTGNPIPVAPSSIVSGGGIYRSWLARRHDAGLDVAGGTLRQIYIPDATVFTRDDTTGETSQISKTNIYGEFIIPKQAVSSKSLFFSIDGGNTFNKYLQGVGPYDDSAETQYLRVWVKREDIEASGHNMEIFGHVTLEDVGLCGIQSLFFEKVTTGEAQLRDGNDNVIAGPVKINAYGDYYLTLNVTAPQQARLLISCERSIAEASIVLDPTVKPGTPPQVPPIVKNFTLPNNSPLIKSITATYKGQTAGLFIRNPSPTPLPSDTVTSNEVFLSRKGLDTRLSSCLYYQAIGAVSGCDSHGNPTNPINFDQWKQVHHMSPYNTSPEYKATFVNFADLNLTRNHHGVKMSNDLLAFYVCNHLGPKGESQTEIDSAIENAVNGKDLVACVAMDYSVTPGVNNNLPFIKYHIFGPSGELLPSINLDGRGEKFVPSTCVGCHGGDHYAGTYPEDGSGVANIGAHYLPYDVENFKFSSISGLTEKDQLADIKSLNLLLLDTDPTPAAKNLIENWYPPGGDEVPQVDYVPQVWVDDGQESVDLYNKVVKTSCRLCHVAFPKYDLDQKNGGNTPLFEIKFAIPTCGNEDQIPRNLSMPSSLVTFNHFWAPDPSDSSLPAPLPLLFSTISGYNCSLDSTPIWPDTPQAQ